MLLKIDIAMFVIPLVSRLLGGCFSARRTEVDLRNHLIITSICVRL